MVSQVTSIESYLYFSLQTPFPLQILHYHCTCIEEHGDSATRSRRRTIMAHTSPPQHPNNHSCEKCGTTPCFRSRSAQLCSPMVPNMEHLFSEVVTALATSYHTWSIIFASRISFHFSSFTLAPMQHHSRKAPFKFSTQNCRDFTPCRAVLSSMGTY